MKWVRRAAAWTGIGILGLALIGVLTIAIAGELYRHREAAKTPAGFARDSAQYVRMSDGALIAVDVFLPRDLAPGERLPVLIKATPYWRAPELTFLAKALIELHAILAIGEDDIPLLTARRYGVMTVDTRGTGASFGAQKIAFDDREIADYGELIDWAARQPWSSGRVGAYGFSYRGMLATDMAALGRPALRAIAPSFDNTDLYLVTHPGGVLDSYFVKAWGQQTASINRGVIPCDFPCHWIVRGPKRVDADAGGVLLARALAEHAGDYDMSACATAAPYRDDRICASGKSLTDVSELARKGAIEASHVPMYVEVGYFDEESPAQALSRFQDWSNSQQLIIGPFSHGGFSSTDPYGPKGATVDPSYRVQVERMADFFDRTLKGGGEHGPRTKTITYYVLGAGVWRTSPVWPPADTRVETWRLGTDHGLTMGQPPKSAAADVHAVDFSASSGPLARYRSPVDLSPTAYPDRAAQDRRLAPYTSPPIDAPLEIAGRPIARLRLASSRADGEVIVYLEDVAPGGGVTYLSEGALRLADRRLLKGSDLAPGGPLHSYLARDAQPMTPAKVDEVDVALSPVAARLGAGHRLRLSVAGADAGNLERLPSSGPEVFTIDHVSHLELPVSPSS
jgi:hypothetical protein